MQQALLVRALPNDSTAFPPLVPSPSSGKSRTSRAASSLQVGLAAYRARALEQWRAHEFYRLTQAGGSAHLTNVRTSERSLLGRCRTGLRRRWDSAREWLTYCWIWLTAIWSKEDAAHSVGEMQQRSTRRTTRLVWTLVVVGFLYWYWTR
jgi:hypothetical protein